ncbi:restriction endonuclease subunit S [Bacteroides fragilis]|uniref:restriction endonuclease subunit S n=1 Tax=Bacteroides fragilis TaxID=817 RepID=UPI002223AA2A|nr:restriction endonuclease subunit S [Bacteroides fragilis]UYV03945.1 restriction endonuclease subunit S [Bacteroides fragilis]
MAIDNKDKKVLKSSIEREQNELACSAEREKIKGSKNLNVPHLRFPEFSGEWYSYPLTDFMSFKNGMNPDAKRFGRGIKFISVMDILNNQFICYDNIRASVEVIEGDIETYGVNYGDILFQRSSETLEDVGQANVYLDRKPAVFGGFVIRGKSKGNYHPVFFRYLLASPTARKRIIVKGAGAQHFNIGQDGLSRVCLNIPSIQEQEKIAKLFECVDTRIATQNKIIYKLKSLIRGIAQNMVHRGKPNVRLSDCMICNSSTLQESEVLESGTYPVYGANGIVGYLDCYATLNEAIYIIKDGSGVGTVFYVAGKCSAAGTLNTLQAKEGYSLQYLYYLLTVFNFEPYKTGMAIPHIYFKDYGKAKVFCPSHSEQFKYTKLLSTIDSKLLAEQNALVNYNLQKQYLLRQMFI